MQDLHGPLGGSAPGVRCCLGRHGVSLRTLPGSPPAAGRAVCPKDQASTAPQPKRSPGHHPGKAHAGQRDLGSAGPRNPLSRPRCTPGSELNTVIKDVRSLSWRCCAMRGLLVRSMAQQAQQAAQLGRAGPQQAQQAAQCGGAGPQQAQQAAQLGGAGPQQAQQAAQLGGAGPQQAQQAAQLGGAGPQQAQQGRCRSRAAQERCRSALRPRTVPGARQAPAASPGAPAAHGAVPRSEGFPPLSRLYA